MNIRILLSFLIAFPLTLVTQILFPSFNLFTLSPFIASLLLYAKKPYVVWISSFSGIFLDLFSSHYFGIYALSYGITAFILYSYRRLFDEKFLGFALCTILISFVLTIFEPLMLFLFQKSFTIHFKWILLDLLLMPLIDGLYAMLCFSFPFFVYDLLKNRFNKLFFYRRGY